jgi:Ca2+/H+ antiporter, TMEM165/GDT1 family
MEDTMSFRKEAGRNFWIKRAIFFPILFVAGVFIFGSIIMYLWNAVLPDVLGVGIITFWQALGILVLSKILFGGFYSRHRSGFWEKCGYDMHEKWRHLSPEEREEIKKKWHSKFEEPDEAKPQH